MLGLFVEWQIIVSLLCNLGNLSSRFGRVIGNLRKNKAPDPAVMLGLFVKWRSL